MPSLIDITKPIYGTPTTQSVRDNFHVARDEISAIQTQMDLAIMSTGGVMDAPLILWGNDPVNPHEAVSKEWVTNTVHGTINTLIYVGTYDAAADKILTSNNPSFPINSALPVAAPVNSQYYFTVKTTSSSQIGNQPPGGVPAGTWLISNGVIWNVFAMAAPGVTAQTVPVIPAITNVPGADVYAALTSIGTNFLLKTGGTLTGLLTLSGAPTTGLHASTKQYVDSSIASLVFPGEAPTDGFSYARANSAWNNFPKFSKISIDTNTWNHISLNSSIASNTANQILGRKDNII